MRIDINVYRMKLPWYSEEVSIADGWFKTLFIKLIKFQIRRARFEEIRR